MKKGTWKVGLFLVLGLLLSACGGGADTDDSQGQAQEAPKHQVIVAANGDMEFKMSTQVDSAGIHIFHLVSGGKEVARMVHSFGEISVSWRGDDAGWSPGIVFPALAGPDVTMHGIKPGDVGIIYVNLPGESLPINLDKTEGNYRLDPRTLICNTPH